MALTLPAQELAPNAEPVLAAQLAASIPIPTWLPIRQLSVVRVVSALRRLGFDVADMSSTLAC
jgi:hypothetical protein